MEHTVKMAGMLHLRDGYPGKGVIEIMPGFFLCVAFDGRGAMYPTGPEDGLAYHYYSLESAWASFGTYGPMTLYPKPD